VASLNLVEGGNLKGRRVECVNIECRRTIKIGWRMKNRCSSIGIQYIVPNIDPAGYDHPPLAIINCSSATILTPLRGENAYIIPWSRIYRCLSSALYPIQGRLRLTININQDTFRTSLRPIIGENKHPSPMIGGMIKISSLSDQLKSLGAVCKLTPANK
jgi:hypothetical protein